MAITYKTATDSVSTQPKLTSSKGSAKSPPNDPTVQSVSTNWSTTLALPKPKPNKAPVQPKKLKTTTNGLKSSR